MYQLAQYVFGVGRQQQLQPINQDNNINNQQPQPHQESTSCYDDSTNNCHLTNIENDWILIDVDNGDLDHQNVKLNYQQTKQHPERRPRKTSNGALQRKPTTPNDQLANKQDETWLVDPPECFQSANNQQQHQRRRHGNKSADCDKDERLPMENLLIEHPSMSVFDQLFVVAKKKPTTTTNKVTVSKTTTLKLANTTKAATAAAAAVTANVPTTSTRTSSVPEVFRLSILNKENIPVTIRSKIAKSYSNRSKKENNSGNDVQTLATNTNTNGNNNQPANVTPSSSTLALASSIKNAEKQKDKLNRKKNITKKQHQRQNKVAIQRNGPVIRQKKMFQHFNGIYHNRNNC